MDQIRVTSQKLTIRNSPASSGESATGANQETKTVVTGLAVPFNTEARIITGLREQFKPGSFSNAIGDVKLLVGHDKLGLPLARTKSGTMRVYETERGVEFEAELDASTPQGQNAVSTIRRGDLDGVSIGFSGNPAGYERSRDKRSTTISWTNVSKLHEISLVAFPAYPTTDIQLRAAELFGDNKMAEPTQDVPAREQVRALVISPNDSADDLFKRARDNTLTDEVRDTVFSHAVEAAQREADKRARDSLDEERAELADMANRPKVSRGGSGSFAIQTTDDSEISDSEIRAHRDLIADCVNNRYGRKDDYTNDEKSIMARKLPSDLAFERWARSMTRDDLARNEVKLREAVQHETRALGTTMKVGTDADGGHTLSYRLWPQLVLEMAATGPMADPMCCRRISSSNGRELRIPKVTSTDSVKAIIEGEGDDIANYKPTFAQTSLTPYKYAMSYPATSEMLQDTEVDITGFLVQNFGIAFGRAMNEAFTTGSGSSQPNGVFTGGTAATAIAKAAAFDKDDFILAANIIDPAYATGNKFFIQLNNHEVGKLRKTIDSGHFLFNQDSGNMGFPGSLLGIPVRINQVLENSGAASKKVMIVGNHDYYVAVTVGMMQIDFSEHFAFGSDQVVYRAKWRFDGDVLIADAFRTWSTTA